MAVSDTDIEAGELDKRINLEQDVATASSNNTTGEHVPNWQAWSVQPSAWASIRQLSAREIERAMTLQIEATHLIKIRYVPGVTPNRMRAKLGTRIFDIGGVNNVNEANVKLEITACERIA